MRAAGRALALDPGNGEAAAQVGRLLLEPPAETPPQVEAAIMRARIGAHRSYMTAGALAYLGYLLFLPALLWLGVKDWTIPIVILVLALGNAGFAYWLSKREARPSQWLYLLAIFTDGLMPFFTSVYFSPLMVMPGIVIASTLTFLASPARHSAIPVVVNAVLVLLLPLALEWAGVLPRTFWIDESGITIRSWVIGSDPVGTVVVLVAANLGLVLTVAQMALHLQRAQADAERKTHLQSWHLRQLVP
ncbi:MAG: hypothetical protein K8M05_33735 [Deltaproteobacteria bacterium]|nr:hypothetical protein [Kofleriaceae bacterium]